MEYGSICTVISIIYIVYNLIYILYSHIKYENLLLAIKIFVQAFSIIIFIIYIVYSMITLKTYITSLKENQTVNHFRGILIDNDLANRINVMDEYLLKKEEDGKTVYILDSMSAIFTIPIDRYYKNYDIFDIGNFGGKGEDGIIEDLKNTDNLLVLIRKDGIPKNWQHPYKITDYAIENFEKIDEIDIYDVYEK